MTTEQAEVTETLIEPSGQVSWNDFRDLWHYRELTYFLAWREVKVRYKQTVIGVAWAVLQPVLNMLIFSLFFGRLAKIPSDGVPYPLFALAGLVPWTLFSNGLSQAGNSLVANANLIKKVYFPRLAIPISSVLQGLVDFCIAFGLLLLMALWYGVSLKWNLLALPLFVLLAVIASLGVGLWLAALNVEYRDVRYVIPFLTQFWMLATPIAYPSSLLQEPWRSVYGLNPMVGVVEGFRWALLGTKPPGPVMFVSAAVSVVLLITAFMYFRRMEESFADVV